MPPCGSSGAAGRGRRRRRDRGGWRREDAVLARAGRRRAEPILVVEGDEALRARVQQPRLLTAPEVARGMHEVGRGLVVARGQRLELAVLVLPRQQLADRAAVAAARQPGQVLRDQPVQDEVHAAGLRRLAGRDDAVKRRQRGQLMLERIRIAAGEPYDLLELGGDFA